MTDNSFDSKVREITPNLLNIKYICQDNNKLIFEVSIQKFNIIIPETSSDYYFIDLPIVLPGYEWLNRINEYIFDKNPTLEKLLTYIDSKYLNEKNNKQTKKKSSGYFDVPDIKFDKFDIEEQKYRKLLQTKIESSKSVLNLTSETNKAPVLFSGNTPGLLIMNEFFELRKKYKSDNRISLKLTDDNIYQWNILLRNFSNKELNDDLSELKNRFGYDYIEIEIHFHDKLYPSYPPFVRTVRPRLESSLMHRITNMKIFQFEYWSPCRTMDTVINKLIEVLNKNAKVDYISEINDRNKFKQGAFHSLESVLIKLASLCDVKDEFEPLDTEIYKKVFYNNNKKPNTNHKYNNKQQTVWKQGTGYGTSGSRDWDPEEYIRIQKEKDQQIQSVISTLIDNIQNYKTEEMTEVYKIINDSYVVPYLKSCLKGNNMLEMNKHIEMFKLLLTFIQLLVTENSMFLFNSKMKDNDKSLFELIQDLNKEAEQVIKFSKMNTDNKSVSFDNDISVMICSLYEMIEPLFTEYLNNISKLESEKQNSWKNKMEVSELSIVNTSNQIYKNEMEKIKFDMVKFNKFSYNTSNSTSTLTMKRLSQEYGSLMKSLPIFFESSIFVRVDEQNMRKLKVLITGPDGTPYDSGCFIFDVVMEDGYPHHTPKMNFTNHGGKRFNPNLYDTGKVCLSLLGTWGGSGGEVWNEKTSTLYQLFVSVQSQILVEQPYYNEPGYEQRNDANTQEKSRIYTNERRWYTLCHAMYDLISNPDSYPEFTDVIKEHFKLKKDYILSLCDKWVQEPNNQFKNDTIKAANKLKDILNKLN